MKLTEITIELTQQCPNKCVHCSSLSSIAGRALLPTEKIFEVIDDAILMGCRSINLSGGEPFLHRNLTAIVEHIVERGGNCNIYTSGICLKDGVPSSIPVRLIEQLRGKVSKYIVNVEASDESTYDLIMGTSFHGFDMMKRFISNLVLMGENVEAHFVPMKLNYHQIPSVVEMCHEMGITRVSFLRFVAQGRGLDNVTSLEMDETDFKTAVSLMKECSNRYKNEIRRGIPFHECEKRVNCFAGVAKLNVRYDGNVYPCEAFKNDQPTNINHASADNVAVHRLIDIYEDSKSLKEFRQWLELYQRVQTCETCFAQYLSQKNNCI